MPWKREEKTYQTYQRVGSAAESLSNTTEDISNAGEEYTDCTLEDIHEEHRIILSVQIFFESLTLVWQEIIV